jgi:predicted dehydrogenase
MDKVRYGVIGIGNMGNGYINDYNSGNIKGGVLTAICDVNEAKLNAVKERLPENCAVFTDPEELIKSGTVDAVVIATPHYDHPVLAIKAFENGLHVVIEKPAGVYTKKVREMNEAAAKSGKKFMIMFQNRTNPLYAKMHELVAAGAIGEIKRVTLLITDWYRPQSYYDSGSWRATWEGEGGGVLLNQAPHNLDLWQWITGMMPSKIKANCHMGKWHDIEVEDDVTAYFEYPNGATGVFVTSTGDYPGTNYFEILGDEGKLVVTGGQLAYYKNKMNEREFNRANEVSFAIPGHERVEVEIPKPEGPLGHIWMMNNFFSSILHDTPLYVPGEEGIKSLMMSNAMYLSGWLDKTVELPIDEDEFLAELNKRRATSNFKAKVSKDDVVVEDISKTFMK